MSINLRDGLWEYVMYDRVSIVLEIPKGYKVDDEESLEEDIYGGRWMAQEYEKSSKYYTAWFDFSEDYEVEKIRDFCTEVFGKHLVEVSDG